MTDYLLIHGAWHGGWCWDRVAKLLWERGDRVFAPSLTGLGDRRHLLAPDVDLSTHVNDVLAVMETEELSNVVLCAHSYGGAVALQAADQAHERIAALVLLDALLPQDGRSLLDLDSEERRNAILSRALDTPQGQVLPPAPAVIYALASADDVAWVDRRCVAQPLKTFQEKAAITGAWQQIPVLAYAATQRFQPPDFRSIAALLAKDGHFTVSELASGHDAMIDAPEDVAALLAATAGRIGNRPGARHAAQPA
ncbi:alpha/beta fold hydrolase [Chelatococcus reniformis]|uniref:Esterase n=1 Tax=Chelatococcus reniformis TaxID=1494448 RepID=A0A916TXY6_9HYPH|nr:alpha/beta hydrolase [Chelatococcus reniformis]GGC48629.1 esterase [Chelatococcus reniformis]